MLERRKPIVMAMGEGVGDSITTRCSTIRAQKDAERKWGNEGPYISLSLDPCQKKLKCLVLLWEQSIEMKRK
jgi:hypothetical protein